MSIQKRLAQFCNFFSKQYSNSAVLIGIIVSLLLVVLLLKQVAHHDETTIVTKDGKQVIAMQLAGATYHIPIEYFKYSTGYPNISDKNLFMQVVLPDMHPIISDSPEIKDTKPGSQGPKVHVLIEDAATTTSHEYRWGALTTIYKTLTPNGEIFGLHRFASSRASYGGLIQDALVFSDTGIVKDPTPEQKKHLFEEIYSDAASGIPTTYLVCNGDTAQARPGCSEHFTDNGLLYDVGFGKDHLAEWRSIKASSIRMMQIFRQNLK